MATKCDSCAHTIHEADGGAHVFVRDAMPDYTLGVVPPYRQAPKIDLCAGCLTKLIDTLGLSDDTFRPRKPQQKSPLMGALSEADLAALGLADAREDGAADAEEPLGEPRTSAAAESLDDEIRRLQAPYRSIDRKLIK